MRSFEGKFIFLCKDVYAIKNSITLKKSVKKIYFADLVLTKILY